MFKRGANFIIRRVPCNRDNWPFTESIRSISRPHLTTGVSWWYCCSNSAIAVGNVTRFAAGRHRQWTFLVTYLWTTVKWQNDLIVWNLEQSKFYKNYWPTFVIPLAWSWTQPTIRVRCAGPQTGQGPQAAALHLGGHGTPPQRRRRDRGGKPSHWAGDTSLSSFPITSTHLYFPTWRPPPQVLEHGVKDIIFQINFLFPMALLSIWDWLLSGLKSGCFDKEGSGFGCSRALVWSLLWWRWWCRCVGWCWGAALVGMSLLVSSSESVKYSYFKLGFGWV